MTRSLWKLGYSTNFPAFLRWYHASYNDIKNDSLYLKLLCCEVGPVIPRPQIAGSPFIDVVSWQGSIPKKLSSIDPCCSINLLLTKGAQLKRPLLISIIWVSSFHGTPYFVQISVHRYHPGRDIKRRHIYRFEFFIELSSIYRILRWWIFDHIL